MNKEKKWIWGAVIVIVLAIIIYAVSSSNKTAPNNQTAENPPETAVPNPAPATTTPTSTPATGTKKLSYGQAIATYKYRFQFSNCHGSPGTISIRVGSPVMLDNRDKVAHTIKADGETFKIAALDYAVFNAPIVAQSQVTCDGGGAAQLNVEK